jgi:hypothetical protein
LELPRKVNQAIPRQVARLVDDLVETKETKTAHHQHGRSAVRSRSWTPNTSWSMACSRIEHYHDVIDYLTFSQARRKSKERNLHGPTARDDWILSPFKDLQ